MARAGKALKQVLETYNITQYRLATEMGLGRSTINHWVKETRDPSADYIPDIVAALEKIDVAAAEEFLKLFLGRVLRKPEVATQKDAE